MATLQKIRNHGPLLIIVVGVAMLAFILGDVLSNVNKLKGGGQPNVGVIAGHVVNVRDFDNTREIMNRIYSNDNANFYTWSSFVKYYTFLSEAEKSGLAVSEDELDRIAPQYAGLPAHLAIGDLLEAKYGSLLQNTLNTTSVEKEFALSQREQVVDAEYIVLPYESVDEVEVSEGEITTMYDRIKEGNYPYGGFRSSPFRVIEYYAIDFVPTNEEIEKEISWFEDNQEAFRTTANVAGYVQSNAYDTTYRHTNIYTEETVPAAFREFAFGSEAQVDAMSPVVQLGRAYAMARIVNIDKAEKTVELAIIDRTPVISEDTKSEFAEMYKQIIRESNTTEEFEQAVKDSTGIVTLPETIVYELSKNIDGIADSRKVVTWAFDAGEDDVCDEVFECGNKLMIAAVKEAHDGKYVSLEKVRNYVTFLAQNEAKAAYIAENAPRTKSLEEIAERYGIPTESKSAARISFDSREFEPALIGAALAQQEGSDVEVVKGNLGIYFVKTTARYKQEVIYNEENEKEDNQNLENKFRNALQYLQNETDSKIYDLNRF